MTSGSFEHSINAGRNRLSTSIHHIYIYIFHRLTTTFFDVCICLCILKKVLKDIVIVFIYYLKLDPHFLILENHRNIISFISSLYSVTLFKKLY